MRTRNCSIPPVNLHVDLTYDHDHIKSCLTGPLTWFVCQGSNGKEWDDWSKRVVTVVHTRGIFHPEWSVNHKSPWKSNGFVSFVDVFFLTKKDSSDLFHQIEGNLGIFNHTKNHWTLVLRGSDVDSKGLGSPNHQFEIPWFLGHGQFVTYSHARFRPRHLSQTGSEPWKLTVSSGWIETPPASQSVAIDFCLSETTIEEATFQSQWQNVAHVYFESRILGVFL